LIAMDEIKRRLALIDAEVHRRSLYAQAVEAAPLLFPATGLMAGIICQEIISSPQHIGQPIRFLWFWCALLAFCTTGIVAGYTRIPGRWRSPVLACDVLLCFVCLGAIRLISFHTTGADDIRQRVGAEEVLATVRGRVATEPHMGEPNWCFGRLVFEDPPSRFYMSLDAVKGGRGWTPATGTIHVRIDEPTPNLKPGDHITVECQLHRFSPPSNPGQFDIARYLSRVNIHVGATVPSRDSITVDHSTRPGLWACLRSRMSQMAAQALLGDARIDDPDEGLVQALLLGSRQTIDPETYEAFRRTGLLHLVSLSGMNFAMLIAMIWWVCRIVGLSKRGRAVAAIIAACVFLMVVPLRAPTVRAAVIVFAYCASILVGRRVCVLNSLCLAAIVILGIGPTQLFDAGWQLSFGCMAGMLALTERISNSVASLMPRWSSPEGHGKSRGMALAGLVANSVILPLSAGLAAWIGGAGFLLYHFYTITPLTSLWTVLTSLLVWAITVTGFLQILLAFLLPTISLLLGDLTQALAHVFIVVVRVMAAPDINLVLVGHVGLWVVTLYYGLVLFWRFGRMKRSSSKPWICAGVLILLVGYLGVLKWQRTHRDDLRMTCLDVGHGQAILVQLPGTRNVLFDAGSLYKKDIGSRIVVPFLDYAGIAKLDAVVISHGDVDHINGIPEIAGHCRIGHLYATDSFLAASQSEPAPRLLVDCLRRKGHTIEPLPERVDSGPVTLETLWPPTESSVLRTLRDNDLSAVSLIRFGDTGVLLCSDIESPAQRRIMARGLPARAQVMVAPHHGSITTAEAGFLSYVNPRFVACSCGRGKHKAIANRAFTAIPEWFHTSVQGAVFVCIGKNGAMEASSWLNHERTGE
jgi:competence protein ComEC